MARLYQEVAALRQQASLGRLLPAPATLPCLLERGANSCLLVSSCRMQLMHRNGALLAIADPLAVARCAASVLAGRSPLLATGSRLSWSTAACPDAPQMHGLEQETAAAVATSQQLQQQRTNLTATLDLLRGMEAAAQVGAALCRPALVLRYRWRAPGRASCLPLPASAPAAAFPRFGSRRATALPARAEL